MKEWLRTLGIKYLPLKDTLQGDCVALWLNIVTGIVLGLSLLFIGIMYLVYGKSTATEPGLKMKQLIAHMIGLFLTTLGSYFLLDCLAYWYNSPYVYGTFKGLAAAVALSTALYIPRTLKIIVNNKSLEKVSEELKETREKIKQLEQVTNKIIEGK